MWRTRSRSHINVAAAAVLVLLISMSVAVAEPVAKPTPPASTVADAAMRGDTETVRSLLRNGEDVNAAQGDGTTALHWAALNGDVATLEVLLYAGATLEATTRLGGYTPLHLAARQGRRHAVSALLDAGSKANARTSTGVLPIHLAAQAGEPAAILALLEHGADVNALDAASNRTPLIYATARSRLRAMEMLIEAGADVSAATAVIDYPARAVADLAERRLRQRLIDAAKEPEDEEPESEPGAAAEPPDPDNPADPAAPAEPAEPDEPAALPDENRADPEDPAERMAAASKKPASPVAPADPDEPDARPDEIPDVEPKTDEPEPLSYTDMVGRQGGMTALHYAARDGRMEAAELLVAAGADVNHLAGGDESSPLLVAIINGNYDLAMMLLQQGADPDALSEDNAGPLFATINNEWSLRTWYPQPTASQRQNTSYLDLMEALLEAGADPNARVKTHIWYAAYNAGRMGVDFSGATPFWRAAYATDVKAMRLLHQYGADPNIPTTKPAPRRSRGPSGLPPSRGGTLPTPGVPGAPATPSAPAAAQAKEEEKEEDHSGLPETPVGGPAVHPLHAASGVGYGTSRVGQQHRHVPDGWLASVKYLIDELGVDVNVRDHDGYSALHNAASRGDDDTVRFLVERGADPTFVSRRGQTTVDMANGPQQRVQPFPSTIALLESHGAVNNNNCISC